MLKHLPDTSLETLLNIFNYIWTTGKFPEDWTLATIIPIPKPGKDPAEPNNYRPVALTSCLCKTLERMINKRLTWFLESNNLISRFQSGFRSDRSTTDNLVRLETFIRDAFIKKEHVVAVFLAHLSQRLMGELIVYQSLRRPSVRPSTFSNIVFSETTGPIKLKFHMETP